MSVALPHAVRGLLVLALLTPFVITPGVFAHFAVSKAIYARVLIEIMFVGWVFLAFRYPQFRPQRSLVLLALFLYVLASLMAAVWGVNPQRSLWSTFDRMTGAVDLIHWSLFALVLVAVVRSPVHWRRLLNWQLGVALVLSLIALVQAYGYWVIPGAVAKCRVDATLGNPSFLAPILAISVLIASGLLVRSVLESRHGEQTCQDAVANWEPGTVPGWQTNALRGFWLAVIALGLLALILTGTRGALMGLVAGALVMPLALTIWGNRGAVKSVALASAGILAVVGVLFALDQSVGLSAPGCASQTATSRLTSLTASGTSDAPLATRLAAWEAGGRGFLQRPLLGWGPENFAYAYDRHVDAWVFRHGSYVHDKAHNQVVEELTTRGILGFLAFLFLWLVLVWMIIRRARPPGEEALAYAVLGALAAYFVQNLFLFDTPSAALVWLVLLGWVAVEEARQSREERGHDWTDAQGVAGRLLLRMRGLAAPAIARPWTRSAAALGLVALLGFSLYSFSLQPYLAARAFGQSSQPGISLADRLGHAEESYRAFPPMASQARLLMFLQLARVWPSLEREDQDRAREFVGREALAGLESDPQNAPLLISAILFIQSTSPGRDALSALDPLLRRLEAIAPHRAETHQLLANQALKEGNYGEALRIARDYQARAPGTEIFFVGIEAAAEAGLDSRRD